MADEAANGAFGKDTRLLSLLFDLWRLARVGVALARADALFPREYRDRLPFWARVAGAIARFGAPNRADMRLGQRLARALARLGPAYVKLGQFLATRPDLIGFDAAADLSTLKDRLPAASPERFTAMIAAELGARAASLPALGPARAAASIAQVHEIRLANGERRALKLLRPGIERIIARDFRALRRGAAMIEAVAPSTRRLAPRELIATVARAAERECDLRFEAAAADELGTIYARIGAARAPKVDWDYTTRRVLALEWIDGAPLTDRAALDRLSIDRAALAADIIRIFLASALDYGVFHADFHEGNLLADVAGRLVIVDFGIIGRLGAAERRYLAEILWGFINRDYQRLAEVHFEAGYVCEPHTPAEFATALRAVGEPIFGKTADQVSMSRLLLHLWDVTHSFDMRLRPELVMLQKTMVQAEGVARALDPKLDLWGIARPVVERWIKRELGPRARLGRLFERAASGLMNVERAAARLAQPSPVPARARNWGFVLGLWLFGTGLLALAAAVFFVHRG